ncbi:MAG: flagellar motor switch phosphatase FliY [Synergistaceae bacterium]|nr:flagellar motor switch phosphatase FliY [Synergistaceae bacterium]
MIDELLSQDEINALLSGADLGNGGKKGPGDISPEQIGILEDLAEVFANSAASVYGMLSGKEVTAAVSSITSPPQKEFPPSAGDEAFVFRLTAGGLADSPMDLVVTRSGALSLADLMMGGEGKDVPEEAGELYLNAAQEGLSQVAGAAFTSLSGMLGGLRILPENISSSLEKDEWLPFSVRSAEDLLWVASVVVTIEGLGDFPLWILLPLDTAGIIAGKIHEAMAGKGAQEPSPLREQGEKETSASGSAPRKAASSPAGRGKIPSSENIYEQESVDVRPAEFVPLMSKGPSGGNSRIDLVADIPVRVTVELGRTRKNISDILNMTPGSVIELDKMAGEPVDVLVNGKLIAKGEVVVIDENFGVRVTEILSSSGRVHAL